MEMYYIILLNALKKMLQLKLDGNDCQAHDRCCFHEAVVIVYMIISL